MALKIIPSQKQLAKNLFKAEEIKDLKKFKYLNLELYKKERFPNDEGFGVYFMFFKKLLIYIGSHCDEKNGVTERWYKHLITNTTRFLDVCFKRGEGNNTFEAKEVKNLLKNKNEKIKHGKVTLDKLINLYKDEKVDLIKYQNLIEERFIKLKQEIKKKYCNQLPQNSTIYKDILEPILDIKFDDNEKYQKILTGGSMAHSPNRFKVAAEFWDDLKSRNENNIFNEFEFYYFKFDNILEYVPEEYKKNIKKIKKKFQNKFERVLIREFNPPTNDNRDKSDKEFKFKHDVSILENNKIENKLLKLYNDQSFFIK